MYIRTISRKNKDGTTVTYVQLAHNERDAGKGYSKAKVLYNFGRLDHLDVEQLKRLVTSITRFLDPQDALETQAAIHHRGKKLHWRSCRSFGGSYLLDGLWQQLNFDRILNQQLNDRSYSTPIVRAIFARVANRCLAPSSKLSVSEWVGKDVYIAELPQVDIQVLYRAMDFLLSHQAELEQEIYWAVADLLNLEVDLLFFDTTSTYFETEHETELKKHGLSKDKRGDVPQLVMGLAVTRSGIPVKHWIFPGNINDMETIKQVKNDLSAWKLNRCIFVHDTGMSSASNLQYLQRGGGHYIVGRKLRSGEPDVEAALRCRSRYTNIADQLWAKQVIIGNGEKRKRLVLVRNDREQQRDERRRQQLIEQLHVELATANAQQQKGNSKIGKRLKAHRLYRRYIKEHNDGHLEIDTAKLKNETRYDGKYLIETSDDTLSLSDIVLGYKQLYDIEDAFRSLKTTLELRPIYHSRDDRIRCHILLCFMALVLIRIVENKTQSTWPKVRDEMSRLCYGEFVVDAKIVCQLTELTGRQKEILSALSIKEPSTIVDIRDR